jgi:hypothetical protein
MVTGVDGFMPKKYGFELTLENLQRALNANSGHIQLLNTGKTLCHFSPPASPEKIQALENRLGMPLPDDYRRFLTLHDGAQLFNQVCSFEPTGEIELGGGLWIFSLAEIDACDFKSPEGWVPVASYSKIIVIIDCNRYHNGTQNYLLVKTEEEPFYEANKIHCNFDLWLERMILTGGEKFWEWSWYTADSYYKYMGKK